jgi:hypothetical protein
VWRRRLYWLISALSGTLETEREIVELRTEKERLRSERKRIESETEQIKRDNERLAELESKIDGLFLKYDIGSTIPREPEKP